MSIAIVLAAPLVGMGIGSLIAFGALGSSALNIPEWAWISFCTSIFVAIPALVYSKKTRKHSRALLISPAAICSLAAFGIMPTLLGNDSDLGPMAEVLDKAAHFVGSVLIGVLPAIVAIGLMYHAWPEITAKPLPEN